MPGPGANGGSASRAGGPPAPARPAAALPAGGDGRRPRRRGHPDVRGPDRTPSSPRHSTPHSGAATRPLQRDRLGGLIPILSLLVGELTLLLVRSLRGVRVCLILDPQMNYVGERRVNEESAS